MSENHSSRFVRWAVALSLVLAVLIVAGTTLYVSFRPKLTYDSARDAAFAGDYEQMQQKLDWLQSNETEEVYLEAVLTLAGIADYNGDHDTAIEILQQPVESETDAYAGFCEKAEEQTEISTYHKALKLYEAGEYTKAARMAAGIRSYAPAQSLYQMAESAYQATLPTATPSPAPTPSPTPVATPVPSMPPAAETVAASPAPTPEAKPELLPEGRLAAGFAHTVVLWKMVRFGLLVTTPLARRMCRIGGMWSM